ncbi:Dynein beta chain, ciliary [Amphibalanus amphitrite]|uniref:Dynein beta chain, ciliary n=1 Tax=Amphibalanus amphitrite TaxID=1232801 RepID=A0A6A4W2Z1_AMPAM|nr:Dynein beta chain, ciliary [Amphibalanus amphitrite]
MGYGHQITPDEIEQFGEDGIPEAAPTLDQFKEQIDSYEKLYLEMEQVEPVVTFDTWFRLDCKPFKAALLNTIKRWSLLFKQYLIDHVTNSLQGLADFITVTDAGLLNQVQEGDYQGLVTMMAHLMAVKERTEATNTMFEPLKQTIELLKTYDVEMAEEIHLQLQELPEKWRNTVKLGIQAKQQVAPLQANEVANVRRSIASFELRQHEYREAFRKLLVFRYDCSTPYEILDSTHLAIHAMETELAKISASAALFEVQIPDFKQLKMCRKEVRLAKVGDRCGVVCLF